MLLQGKTALVTGAGGGIGRVIARTLCGEGARVVCCDRDGEAAAQAAQGLPATAEALDISDEGQVRALFARLGRLDILVNCAGVLTRQPFLDTTLENWERTFAVNARGTFLMTREGGRLMAAAGGGAIVNISSGSGKKPCRGEAAYGASKLAVIGITQVAALELGPSGVRCNAVCPGSVQCGMAARDFLNTPEGIEAYRASTALRRIGQPEDVADAAVYLASDKARHVTGAVLVVSGGEYYSL